MITIDTHNWHSFTSRRVHVNLYLCTTFYNLTKWKYLGNKNILNFVLLKTSCVWVVFVTLFEEIISEKYDTMFPGNEVVVFEITVDRGKEYKIAPMLCDSFCIMLVTSGVVKLSVNYSTVDLGKSIWYF